MAVIAWLQLLANVDAVAVRVGEDEAAQPVIGITNSFDDADSSCGEVITQTAGIGFRAKGRRAVSRPRRC
ncbi:hypothetical protein ABIB25_003059 [Nakamurella sp. UYEF19]